MVPFCPFHFGVSLLKQNSGKKGTLIIKGLLGNLANEACEIPFSSVQWISSVP